MSASILRPDRTTPVPPAADSPGRGRNYARRYWLFALPAAIIVAAVIVFPWIFTLFMSVHDWKVTGSTSFVGFANYLHLLEDERFRLSVVRTIYFTVLSVAAPMVLGIAAAVCFQSNFFFRGVARTIFILPMMATPVAVALVWTMMFHPQLGVLNYLLTSVGLPPSTWVYDASTVIPTLVMVETWQWTPLVMLIVLGGLNTHPVLLGGLMALCGAGFGLFSTPNNRTIIGNAPKARAGSAGGLQATSRLLGTTTGTTVVALCFQLLGAEGAATALVAGIGFAAMAAVLSLSRRGMV